MPDIDFGSSASRVLILDDDPDILELMELILGNTGLQVEAVSTATEALELHYDDAFDIVLTDHDLPDMLGTDFVRHLNTAAPRAIFVCSGGISDSTKEDYVKLGVHSFLPKPFHVDELTGAVMAVAA